MRPRRFEILLFALAWSTYAYFHQGGGWNQNGRFAMTRALVESRRPWIDDYVVYAPGASPGSTSLRRLAVRNGVFEEGGRSFALGWYTAGGPLTPLSPDAPPTATLVPVDAVAVTGDLAFARGHVHPNKAPGVSLAAVPGYALVRGIERLSGVDPDDARVMNLNAWLTGALSVGVIAALGVVLFWRLALTVSGGRKGMALFATIAFGFGTLYFPYATMLYDHDVVAAALIASFLFAWDAGSSRRLVLSGVCAGAAILASYLSVIAAAILGVYVFVRSGTRGAASFLAGTIPAAAVLGAYNLACFGTLVTTNYAWQNPLYKDGGGMLAVFGVPDGGVLAMLLVSPMRGLFAITPVLVLGLLGGIAMARSPRLRAEAAVCAAMIAHVLLFNVAFKAWHGGWACGPRYLIPALPFLALPIAAIAERPAWLRHGLLAISIAAMSLATVVDAQPPWVDGAAAQAPPPRVSPIWDVDLPVFLHERPAVSVNTGGVFEAVRGRFFPLGGEQSLANSFNVGELVWPGRRASLIPWALGTAALAYLLRRELARDGQGAV
jgi:hypothetical protein